MIDNPSAWFDAGSFDSLLEASNYVRAYEQRQGVKIGCLEEACYRTGFIPFKQLQVLARQLKASGYGEYLSRVSE